jgi:hypothetical protein
MWPRWMPSVASARSAARFDASPTEAATSARSSAQSTLSKLSASRAVG